MKKLLATLVLAASATMSAVADDIMGSITDSQGTHKGVVRYSMKSKTYIVQTKQGGTLLEVEIIPADISSMDIVAPKGWEQAVGRGDVLVQ